QFDRYHRDLHSFPTRRSSDLVIISSSVPKTSDNNNSLPSQSTFRGSSKEISVFNLLLRRRYINISFSIHREAYVANLIFFSGLYVFTRFISLIALVLIKSSILIPVFSNFRAIYTTRRKFRSIKTSRSDLSPCSNNSSNSLSSSIDNGGGKA